MADVRQLGVVSRYDLPGLLRHVAAQIENKKVDADTVIVIASRTTSVRLGPHDYAETISVDVWSRGAKEDSPSAAGILYRALDLVNGTSCDD